MHTFVGFIGSFWRSCVGLRRSTSVYVGASEYVPDLRRNLAINVPKCPQMSQNVHPLGYARSCRLRQTVIKVNSAVRTVPIPQVNSNSTMLITRAASPHGGRPIERDVEIVPAEEPQRSQLRLIPQSFRCPHGTSSGHGSDGTPP